MNMNVGVVGSRHFPDLSMVRRFVNLIPRDSGVVSGGAPGVDTAAEDAARARGLSVIVHPADWFPQGPDGPMDRAAGVKRNGLIVRDATRMASFWYGKSKGTKDSMDKADRAGVPLFVFRPFSEEARRLHLAYGYQPEPLVTCYLLAVMFGFPEAEARALVARRASEGKLATTIMGLEVQVAEVWGSPPGPARLAVDATVTIPLPFPEDVRRVLHPEGPC